MSPMQAALAGTDAPFVGAADFERLWIRQIGQIGRIERAAP